MSQLTPELVLVSPDLAEAARAGLPDRPWEMFAPAGVVPTTRDASGAVRERSDSGLRRRGAWLMRLPIGPVLLLVLVAALVYSAFPPLRDAPSFGEPARASPVAALPSTFFMFGRSGRLVTGVDGRTIAEFEVPFGCLGAVHLRAIGIGTDGTFNAMTSEAGRIVVLSGAVVKPNSIRGIVIARSPSCRAVAVSFVARAT